MIFELLIMELADGLKIHYLWNWGIPLPIQITFFWQKLVTRFWIKLIILHEDMEIRSLTHFLAQKLNFWDNPIFLDLFRYPTSNFGPLSREQLYLPNVNHRALSSHSIQLTFFEEKLVTASWNKLIILRGDMKGIL